MSQGCLEVWQQAEFLSRAYDLDNFSSECGCQNHSLHPDGGTSIGDEEILVRILTCPNEYSLETSEIVSLKLRAVFGGGLSLIRKDAPESEIVATIDGLTASGAEDGTLVGAVIMRAKEIRALSENEKWFCVYHTQQDNKTHHADVVATKPKVDNRSALRRAESDRRSELQKLFESKIVYADTTEKLLLKIRESWQAPAN